MTQARGSRVKRAQTTMRKGASLAAFRAYSIHKKRSRIRLLFVRSAGLRSSINQLRFFSMRWTGSFASSETSAGPTNITTPRIPISRLLWIKREIRNSVNIAAPK